VRNRLTPAAFPILGGKLGIHDLITLKKIQGTNNLGIQYGNFIEFTIV
jgi:hypothetical protein